HQSFRARRENCALDRAQRIRRRQARSLRKRTGRDQNRGRAQAGGSEIKFSSARSFRAWRDHVPNRDRDCSHFGANAKTRVLDGESGLRHCWLHLSRAWFWSLTCESLPSTLPCATPASQLSMQITEKPAHFTSARFTMRRSSA